MCVILDSLQRHLTSVKSTVRNVPVHCSAFLRAALLQTPIPYHYLPLPGKRLSTAVTHATQVIRSNHCVCKALVLWAGRGREAEAVVASTRPQLGYDWTFLIQ
ncbi:hypothetical protein AOLI_G00220030 [Acnodon oligacanthus]